MAPAVLAADPGCTVDVYGLDVTGSTIRGNVKNTGGFNESVSYDIWVEKGSTKTLIKNGSLDMIPEQVHAISHVYGFGTGSYVIKLNASADCGSSDYESMGHIVLEGFVCTNPDAIEGQTRCDYAEKEYQECTTSGWQVIDRNEEEYCYSCPNICGDGECNCGENTTTCIKDCGTGRCRAEYLDEYRCLGGTKQRKVRLNDCTEEWRDDEDCVHGCTSGECNPGPGQIAGCGVKIRTFDYMSSVTKSGSPYVTAMVENTGGNAGTFLVKLMVGHVEKGSHTLTLDAGEEYTKTFDYPPPTEPGDYQIKVSADAFCGSTDAATATLSVVEQGQVVVPPSVVVPPEAPLQTSVDLFPTLIDVVALNSKVIVIDIDSSTEQLFTIDVEGAPYHWFEHPGSVTVEREESVYIYMTPDESGTYELTVSVTAESEGMEFESKVDVFVAPHEYVENEDTILGYATRQLVNMIAFVSENVYAVVILIIVAFVVVILIGKRHLKTEYEELLPGL